MNTTPTPADELRTAEGRLAALRAWKVNHPESAFTHPHIKPLEERVRALTTRKDTPDMHDIQVMVDHVATLTEELRTLDRSAGDRTLSPAQQARWDELSAEVELVERNIETAKAADERRERIDRSRARWGSVHVGQVNNHVDAIHPADVARMDASTARDVALRLLATAAGHLTDDQRAHVEQIIRQDTTPNVDADALNKHIVMTNSDAYRSAFRKLTAPSMSTIVVVSEREAEVVAAVTRASMAEGNGATGGYAVPSFLDPTLVLNAQGAANPIRRLARNEIVTGPSWKGVGTTGATWEFVGEGQASTDASPEVSGPTVDVHTARSWITYSIELQQDAVDLDGQLLRLLGNGWEDTVAGVLATGSGSGAPKGIITALDAITASEVSITAAGSLAPGDVSKAWVSLPDRARENASWVMSESVREHVASWGDEYGNRSVDLGGRLSTLRGRPVYSTEKFPAIATTTASANQLVVGDFSGYLIAQRAGMTVEPVATVVNGSGLPTGQRGLFAWARIGADVVDPGLLRLLQQ